MLRRRRALSALFLLVLGVFIFVYRGPGWRPIRHTMGDLVVTPFLIFTALCALPAHRGRVVVGVGIFAFLLEAAQLLRWTRPDDPWWVQATVGSTADPLDLVAYALGCAGAYAADRWLLAGAPGGRGA